MAMPNCLWISVLLDLQHIWPRFAQRVINSRRRRSWRGFFGPLLLDVLSPFFQDERPGNGIRDIHQKKTQKQ